ncbi:MAG TPA: IPTL-CTERM sorting domain-containing protein, partial [Thermoanaerobaculia bacterium]|nr:IPTL-CTERM sorting domain-containing protein [Thermoanaerobaculia bacterium]
FPPTLTANYSLIEAPGDSVLVGAHNRVGVDPLLGPLAGNGGPTLTQRPLPGSPAIDAGDPAIPSPPATDQLGFARIFGPAVDLGSVEVGQQLVGVPALSAAGLLLLAALLCAVSVRRLRRERAS